MSNLENYNESILDKMKKCQEYEGYFLDYFESKKELSELGIVLIQLIGIILYHQNLGLITLS